MPQGAPLIARKKPTTVEAWVWDGSDDQADRIVNWVEEAGGYASKHPYEKILIVGADAEGVAPTDVVVRDQFNDFWRLPRRIFDTVYEGPVL